MDKLWNVSSSPHARTRMTTGSIMYDVVLALMPATVFGVYRHGLHAFLVIMVAVLSAVLTEFVFDYVAHRPNTIKDGSAVVTGLLLALCLPGGIPLYVPYLGSLFAVLFVKCFFGGLGHNFMNPALAGRCFLLISFSGIMTSYTVDGISSATPLAELAAGGTIDIAEMFLGYTNGVIGSSIFALMIGGLYLWVVGVISFEIPVSVIASFLIFIGLFGGQGFDPKFLLAHLCGGGIVMGALFMATDPVTSPITSRGHWIYGIIIGVLTGVFRIFGSAADSASYAIILANLTVPLIDMIAVPAPFGNRRQREIGEKKEFPKAAFVLCAITLLAGLALSGVYELTKDTIEKHQMEANLASYQTVCPTAADFSYDDDLTAAIEALEGAAYGTAYGRVYINEAIIGTDDSGAVAGYVVSVTTAEGFDGNITLSVGFLPDGTIQAIEFTEIKETAGMGMLCNEPAFKDQFAGAKVDAFTLLKSGGASAPNQIDSVSGASITSGAVVNAVNAAIDFYKNHIQ